MIRYELDGVVFWDAPGLTNAQVAARAAVERHVRASSRALLEEQAKSVSADEMRAARSLAKKHRAPIGKPGLATRRKRRGRARDAKLRRVTRFSVLGLNNSLVQTRLERRFASFIDEVQALSVELKYNINQDRTIKRYGLEQLALHRHRRHKDVASTGERKGFGYRNERKKQNVAAGYEHEKHIGDGR